MTIEEQKNLEQALKARFIGMHEMLRSIERYLKQHDIKQAHEFINPVVDTINGAVLSLIMQKYDRELEGNQYLGGIDPSGEINY